MFRFAYANTNADAVTCGKYLVGNVVPNLLLLGMELSYAMQCFICISDETLYYGADYHKKPCKSVLCYKNRLTR